MHSIWKMRSGIMKFPTCKIHILTKHMLTSIMIIIHTTHLNGSECKIVGHSFQFHLGHSI